MALHRGPNTGNRGLLPEKAPGRAKNLLYAHTRAVMEDEQHFLLECPLYIHQQLDPRWAIWEDVQRMEGVLSHSLSCSKICLNGMGSKRVEVHAIGPNADKK